MKHLLYIFCCSLLLLFVCTQVTAQPTAFSNRGPGGGGALFASSFNPTNPNEIYVCCDMSEIFHTTDLGASWSIPDFRQIQSSKLAAVQFTGTNGVTQYAIDGTSINGSDASRPSKSTDGGQSWTRMKSDPTSAGAYGIFVDPSNDQHILISDYSTLYGSIDGGATFSQKYHTTNNSAGLLIAGTFFDGNNIYVGTNEGVLVSSNGGGSFAIATITGIPASEFIVSFCAAKQNSTTRMICITANQVYAGITGADYSAYKHIYKTDVGNGAWTLANTGIDATAKPFFASMSSANINVAYVAGGSTNSAPIVYKTTDGGTTWSSVLKTSNNQNIFTGWSGTSGDRAWSYGEYALGFAVSPSDPNYAVITDLGFAHTTSDGGATWHIAAVPLADQNPSGSATPKGRQYHSVGLENTTNWQIHWFDKNTMFGCYSDIQGTRSTDAGATWGFGYSGHSDNSMYYIVTVPAPGTPSGNRSYGATGTVHDMYQSTTLGDSRIDNGKGKVLFSTDNGATWQLEHDFAHPVVWLAASPTDPNTIYASVLHSTQGGIFVTHNANTGVASTWTKLATPPRTEGHPYNIRILNNGEIVCSYSGRRTSVFTASSGIFYSTDGGTSWVDRSDAGMYYWTKDVVIDPYDATQNTWYGCVFSGWGGAPNGKGGLYKTTNRGTSWVKIHNEDRVTSCTFSPSNSNILYFTSETDGLFYSGNRQAATPTFSQVLSYPFRQPERVFYNPYDSTEVWVTSFGNGMRVSQNKTIPKAPDNVVLVSPVNTSTGVAIDTMLKWAVSSGAETYTVNISTDPLFSSAVVSSTSSATSFSPATLLTSTTYHWRVQAANGAGNAPWSETWSFTTKKAVIPTPTAPTLLLPIDNASQEDTIESFKWSSVVNATKYHFDLSKDATFATHISQQTISDTVATVNALQHSTTYYWKVQAVGADNSVSSWSTARSFTTKNPVTSVSTNSDASSIQVEENPFASMLTLRVPLAKNVAVTLYDLLGRDVCHLVADVQSNRLLQINTSDLPSGQYVLKTLVGNDTQIFHLIHLR